MLLEGALSGRPSLSPQRDRLDGRPVGRPAGRRGGVFPHLLRPEQRDPVRRGRFSARRRPSSGSRNTSARCRAGRRSAGPKPSVPKLSRRQAHHDDRRGEPAPRRADLADRAGAIIPTSRRSMCWRPSWVGCPRRTGCSAPSCTTVSLRPRSSASHPTQLLSGKFEVELYARPGQKLDELVKIADAEIERLKKEGPTPARGPQGPERAGKRADHGAPVGDAQGQRSQPVHGHATAIRSAIGPSSRRSSPSLRRTSTASGQSSTSARIGSSSTSCPARRRRDRPKRRSTAATQAPLASPAVAEVKDTFDRSVMPKLGPTPHYVPPRFERRTALQRPGAADRRAPRAADRDVRPGRQVGRDLSRPRARKGWPRSPPACSTRGRKPATALQMAGELAEIGAVARRRWRAGIDHGQPDHARRGTWTGRSTCTPT